MNISVEVPLLGLERRTTGQEETVMRIIGALVIAVTLLFGSTAAVAGDGAAVGTVLGATIGALTFNNKNTGAAVGAGVGLMAGMIVDAEKRRAERERAERVQAVRPTRTTMQRYKAPTSRQAALNRGQTYERPAQYAQPSRSSSTGHIVRERRVTTRLPDGRIKEVITKVYDDPGW